MRTLLLFRGSAGCGKSTKIEEWGLKPYALSPDEIRMQYNSLYLDVNGNDMISQSAESKVWATLFEILEERMKRGCFTVIDATNSKTRDMQRYKDLADKYRYRIFIYDMTNVPIEECKRRNRLRKPEYKRVPDKAIDKMYARFETQRIPSGIKKIDDLIDILYRPTFYGDYENIMIIGDIHGSYTPLKQMLGINSIDTAREDLNTNWLYIFVGDYLDRGAEIEDTISLLLKIYDLPNVVMLEGNHEGVLRDYANDFTSHFSREFEHNTKPVLDKMILEGKITKKDLAKFCRKLGQISYFIFGGRDYLVSHGGVPCLYKNPIFVPTEQFIRGVGEYEDTPKIYDSFTEKSMIQIHGHRNSFDHPVKASDNCYNLEGGVEFGGYLRALVLDANQEPIEVSIKNNVVKQNETEDVVVKTPEDPVESLRQSSLIRERKMGDISSFNFTRDAFYGNKWNGQSIKARGLFVDTRDNSVYARAYNKFFNVNQMPETRLVAMKENLQFPLTAYVKENGFLGLITYDKDRDCLEFATKSVIDSSAQTNDLVNVFKENFYNEVGEKYLVLLDYLRDNNVTLVCECVDPVRDPHIIEYAFPHVYVLDIVENDFEFKKRDYQDVQILASKIGLRAKAKAFTFNTWKEFYEWYLEVNEEEYQYNGNYIEGFVVEDAKGFMFKMKLYYYNTWKQLRGLTETVLKQGHYRHTGSLDTPLKNLYYKWVQEHRNEYVYKDENGKRHIKNWDIISMRNRFLKDNNVYTKVADENIFLNS